MHARTDRYMATYATHMLLSARPFGLLNRSEGGGRAGGLCSLAKTRDCRNQSKEQVQTRTRRSETQQKDLVPHTVAL